MQNNIQKEIYKKEMLSDQFKADLTQYSGNWIWRAVECLVTAKDFNPSPRMISQRLNITLEQAFDAIEGLLKIGVIEKCGDTYKKAESMTIVDGTKMDKADLLQVHSKLAPQIISKLNTESIFYTQISLGTLALIEKHKNKLFSFLDSVDEDASRLENPDVYAFEVSIAKLSSNTAGGIQ